MIPPPHVVFPPGSVVWIRCADHVSIQLLRDQLAERAPEGGWNVQFLLTGTDLDVADADLVTERELIETMLAARRRPSVQDQVAMLREKFLMVKKP